MEENQKVETNVEDQVTEVKKGIFARVVESKVTKVCGGIILMAAHGAVVALLTTAIASGLTKLLNEDSYGVVDDTYDDPDEKFAL